jgi:hypothetical protein
MKYEPRRLNKQAVGTAGISASTLEATHGPSSFRSPSGVERYLVGVANRSPMARLAKTLREMDNHLQSISALAKGIAYCPSYKHLGVETNRLIGKFI